MHLSGRPLAKPYRTRAFFLRIFLPACKKLVVLGHFSFQFELRFFLIWSWSIPVGASKIRCSTRAFAVSKAAVTDHSRHGNAKCEQDSKSVEPQGSVGSNPTRSAILTKRYRCVWRKVRRINRFRAFSSPDFFSQTIDANRCFRASAPIRTGRFPVSCRCVQPAPFFSGDFSGWQRYFSQKRITKIWASFCWS